MLVTIAQTREAYPKLPQRVPINISINGTASQYGPRPLVWLPVGIQLVCCAGLLFAGYAIAVQLPGTHGSLRGVAIIAPVILAMIWRVQQLLLAIALSQQRRANMGAFWAFFAGCMAVVIVTAFTVR